MMLTNLILLLLSSCALPPKEKAVETKKKTTVRLTIYWKSEDGWTRCGFTSTGGPLISYETVAVDPRVFPYGSVIEIPELGLKTIARDTGKDVVTRKAAKQMGRNVPVLDLYIEKRKDALDFIKDKPYFVDVIVKS